MKNQLNQDFIRTIAKALPVNINLASFMMEVLSIGKEAAYRRLRNEVPLSFQEISLIAKKIGLSIDHFLGNYDNKSALFGLNLIYKDNAMNNYCETLERYMRYFDMIKGDPACYVSTACNTIPFILYARSKYITRFRLCRWIHQSEHVKMAGSLEQLKMPEKIIQLQQDMLEVLKEMSLINLIFDSHIFISLIKDVKYFYNLHIITQEDVEHIREELYDLIDLCENLATEGTFDNGKPVDMYLSNINFEASYSYVEKKDFKLSFIRLYSVNSMDSLHPEICRIQKEWIQSLKRYSTLISQSGEMQRINFFVQQRKYVDEL